MSCLKGKNKTRKEKAKYVCKKCKALTDKKSDLCKPLPYKYENTKKQNIYAGVDIGGTKIAVYLFDKNLNKLARKKRKTQSTQGETQGIDRVIETINILLDKLSLKASDLSGIGMAIPGILDTEKGTVVEAPNLGWKDLKIKKIIQDKFKCPVVIANDVDAGVYGEYKAGSGKEFKTVLGIFPGTGVGGGFIKDGKLFTSSLGSALEIGHIQVQPEGPLCGCGKRGCLETLSGRLAVSAEAAKAAYRGQAPYLKEKAGTDISLIKSGLLKDAIDNGDKIIRDIICESAEWLGTGIASAVNILTPELVIIGGGMAEAMPEIIVSTAENKARSKVLPSLKNSFKVTAASLGDDAVPLGAAALVITR